MGVEDQGWGHYVRPATADDDAFLYDVFCTTWEHEAAALPNRNLVQHFLRIQYTAQGRKFAQRFPGHERWVVLHGDQPAGRFFLHRATSILHIVELTLLPQFRSLGIGSALLRGVMDEAAAAGQTVSLRVRAAQRAGGQPLQHDRVPARHGGRPGQLLRVDPAGHPAQLSGAVTPAGR